jgi:hypothetical protein
MGHHFQHNQGSNLLKIQSDLSSLNDISLPKADLTSNLKLPSLEYGYSRELRRQPDAVTILDAQGNELNIPIPPGYSFSGEKIGNDTVSFSVTKTGAGFKANFDLPAGEYRLGYTSGSERIYGIGHIKN